MILVCKYSVVIWRLCKCHLLSAKIMLYYIDLVQLHHNYDIIYSNRCYAAILSVKKCMHGIGIECQM